MNSLFHSRFVCNQQDDRSGGSSGGEMHTREKLLREVRSLFRNYPHGMLGPESELLEDGKFDEAAIVFKSIQPEIEDILNRYFGITPDLRLVAVRQDFMHGMAMESAVQFLLEIRSPDGEILVPSRLEIDKPCILTPARGCQDGFSGIVVEYVPYALNKPVKRTSGEEDDRDEFDTKVGEGEASEGEHQKYRFMFFSNRELFEFFKTELEMRLPPPLIVNTLKESLVLSTGRAEFYEVQVSDPVVKQRPDAPDEIHFLVTSHAFMPKSDREYEQVTLVWSNGGILIGESSVYGTMESSNEPTRPSIGIDATEEIASFSTAFRDSWQWGMISRFGISCLTIGLVEIPEELQRQLKDLITQTGGICNDECRLEVDSEVVVHNSGAENELCVFVGFSVLDEYGNQLMPLSRTQTEIGNKRSRVIAKILVSSEFFDAPNRREALSGSLKSVPDGKLSMWGVAPGPQWIRQQVTRLVTHDPEGILANSVEERISSSGLSQTTLELVGGISYFPGHDVGWHPNDHFLARLPDGSSFVINFLNSGVYLADGSSVRIEQQYYPRICFLLDSGEKR